MPQKDWKNAARHASNLSELYLTLGDVTAGARLTPGRASNWPTAVAMLFSEWSTERPWPMRCTRRGNWQKRKPPSARQRRCKRQDQPEFPLLYSLRGFRYCDLLLSQGKYAEVQSRASQTLEWAKQYRSGLLDIALDHLSLGRALLDASAASPGAEAERARP